VGHRVPRLKFDHEMREELHERAYRHWDRYYTSRCEQSDEEIARHRRRIPAGMRWYWGSPGVH